MNFTINCTRVPIPRGTIYDGMPLEIGPAPATPGLESDRVSLNGTNEGISPNAPARDIPDGEVKRPKQQLKLLKCKQNTILSTFNVRTLGPKSKRLEELVHCAQTNSINIIGIQEHRIYHPDEPKQCKSVAKYQLVTSSGTKNSSNATVGGVGFLLSPQGCRQPSQHRNYIPTCNGT